MMAGCEIYGQVRVTLHLDAFVPGKKLAQGGNALFRTLFHTLVFIDAHADNDAVEERKSPS